MTLVPGTPLGSYQIVAPIGAGGMGEVYRAHDERLARDVAIKVLPEGFGEDAARLRRFEHEARALAALNHPNIVTVFEVGSHEGMPYLVMELLEGETLRSTIVGRPVPVQRVVEVGLALAQALAAAHEKGILHRDLKPENVFLTRDGRIKILDFGLAKTHAPAAGALPGSLSTDTLDPAVNLTGTGVVLGTAGYMSPEQVRGEPLDGRSDLFALGMVLWEMASGSAPFHRPSRLETLNAILREEPPPLPPEVMVPPAVDRILRRCLAKDPRDRFHSGHDLAFALEGARGGSGSGSIPAPPRPRTSAWLKLRGPIAGALVVLLVFGLARVRHWPPFSSRPQPVFHKLSFGKGALGRARFTPDGNSVLYDAAWEGRARELFTTRIDAPGGTLAGIQNSTVAGIHGSEAALILSPSYRTPALAPGTLATWPLGGGSPRAILEGVIQADWSADGQQFAVVRSGMGQTHLEYPVGHVLFSTGGWIGTPRISPDGRRVAFSHYLALGDAFGDLMIADQGGVSFLSGGWRSILGLAWSPDGSEVWFSAGEVWGWDSLYAVRLDGQIRTVLRAPNSLILMDIFKDGRTLLLSGTMTNELWGRGPGETAERAYNFRDATAVLGVSGDGRSLLFSEVGSGGGREASTFLLRLDGSPPTRLGDGLAGGLSADGAWALSIRYQARPALQLIPTGAGETRVLPLGTIARYHWARVFPDGRRILIDANEAGRPRRLFIQDLAAGAPRPLSEEGVEVPKPNAAISPDGKQIVAIREGRPVRLSVEDGKARPIDGLGPGETPFAWTRDGRTLFVADSPVAGARQRNIFRFTLATQTRTPWKTIEMSEPAGARLVYLPVIALDGDAYFYTVIRVLNNLYSVEGLR